MDKNGDGVIDYGEFCNLTEDKRKNLDPFENNYTSPSGMHEKSQYSNSIMSRSIDFHDEAKVFERKKHLFDPMHFLDKSNNHIARKQHEITECVSIDLAKFKNKKLKQGFRDESLVVQD